MYQIVPWMGLELAVRSNSVDQANLDWMATSPFLRAFENARIADGDVILDVGAHIGSFSLLAATRRPCRVVAFEPDTASLTLCQINALLNRSESRISCHQFAIQGNSGKITLYEATENWAHTTVPAGDPYNLLSGQKTEVDCLSLHDALALADCGYCAFLKFNIEGAEFDMFDNTDVHTLKRIGSMVGEIHGDIVRRSADAMCRHLAASGFSVDLTTSGETRGFLVAQRK